LILLRNVRQTFLLCFIGLALAAAPPHTHAQAGENTMTGAEVEKLRDASFIPNDRIDAFVKILDSRAKSIDELLAKRRRPGREQDLHDLFDQVSGIADELNDNLDDLGPKHRDIRRALPKLIEATERWSTSLRAAADDPAYNVVRKLALDAVRDVHDAAVTMQTDQIAYFKAHPEAAKAEKDRVSAPSEPKPIEIPR
jgi:hypothetical protein